MRYTGVSNRLILENFSYLAATPRDVRVRVPLVPGVTDDRAKPRGHRRAGAASAGVTRMDLLPYHTAGLAKYDRLGRSYQLPDAKPPAPDALDGAREQLERLGLSVHLGG